jgi:hypothetical protein
MTSIPGKEDRHDLRHTLQRYYPYNHWRHLGILQMNTLFTTYCNVSKIKMVCLPTFEKQCFDAEQAGMTPEDVILVYNDREWKVKKGRRYKPCLLFRNFFGTTGAVADVIQEAGALRALHDERRRPRTGAGKATVLRATYRAVDPDAKGVRTVGEILAAMTQAVNETKHPIDRTQG